MLAKDEPTVRTLIPNKFPSTVALYLAPSMSSFTILPTLTFSFLIKNRNETVTTLGL